MVDRDEVIGVLKTCYDPEIPINIYDLGLIYEVRAEGNRVEVDMTLTSPGCPVGPAIKAEVHSKIKDIPGVEESVVNLKFDPPWNPKKASEEGKLQLELMGISV